ncbi:hypothetical protein BH23BAC4_BH23BAC4_12440 [soil metagenome]
MRRLTLAIFLSFAAATFSLAQSLPSGFYFQDAANGARFTLPVAAAFTPDGRMLVVEKRGMVWVVDKGQRLTEPLIDLRNEVMSHHDRGLLGIAVDPAFVDNGYVYLLYTVDHDGTGNSQRTDAFARLSRFQVSAWDPNRLDPASRHVLLGETFQTGIPSCYYSHTIGTVLFGTDGTLLVGTGEAAHYGRVDAGGLYPDCFGPGRLDASEDIGAFRSLRPESLAGKILRVDSETGLGLPSNPFYTGNPEDNRSRVWAMGLRNPFRFSLLPAGSTDPADGDPGALLIGDVGWGSYEELNLARGGENFGWPCMEGPNALGGYQAATPATNDCGVMPPATKGVAWFHHQNADLSSPTGLTGGTIVAGDVYQGTRYPAQFQGAFFMGDYSRGWIGVGRIGADDALVEFDVFSPSAGPNVHFVYDSRTEHMYLVNIGSGEIRRLRHSGGDQNQPPVAIATATPTQGATPLTVAVSANESFDPEGAPITYEWDFGDGTTAAGETTSHTYTEIGLYTARLTVRDDFGAVGTSSTEIRVGREVPTIAMLSPEPRAGAVAGQEVTLRVAVDGTIPLEITWHVDQIHSDHFHPDIFTASGPEAAFMVPEHGSSGEVVFYTIRATVTDGDGLTASISRALRVAVPGETDVTAEADIIALITNPIGGGSRDLEVIRDGVMPAPGTFNMAQQYDTQTGGQPREEDWIGYSFSEPQSFSRMLFQEGIHFPDGGWFEDLRVEVRQNGEWLAVPSMHIEPAFRAADGENFSIYQILFDATEGDGVRVIGTPGGSANFISIAELRVWALRPGGLPEQWASTDIGPVAVAGEATYADGVYTVRGAGDVWGDSDALHFVYRSLPSEGTLTTRLVSVDGQNSWAKAGLMIRESLSRESRHGFLLGTPSEGVHLQWREAPAAMMQSAPGPSPEGPVWLRIVRSGDAVAGYASIDGLQWELVGSVPFPSGAGAYVGLATTATDFEGRNDRATAVFDVLTLDVESVMPIPWASTDVGPVAAAGTVEYASGTFQITGAGDVWGDADSFHFLHQPLSGDGGLQARLVSTEGINPWAKIGIMVRGSLERGAPHAFVLGTPGRGIHLQYRADEGQMMQSIPGSSGSAPIWLRIERSGDTITGYTSATGTHWTPFASTTVALGASPLMGLAVTSTDFVDRNDKALGIFSNVTLWGQSQIDADPPQVSGAEGPEFALESIYPNPSTGPIGIIVGIDEPGYYAVEIFDILGRTIRRQELREDAPGTVAMSLDLSGSAAGVYIARVRNLETGRTATRRLTLR